LNFDFFKLNQFYKRICCKLDSAIVITVPLDHAVVCRLHGTPKAARLRYLYFTARCWHIGKQSPVLRVNFEGCFCYFICCCNVINLCSPLCYCIIWTQ